MTLLKKQQGAVMIEAAYVLPLILIAMLAIVDAVNYAADAIQTTQVVQNAYSIITTQAQARSVDESAAVTMVSCSGGQVELQSAAVQTFLTEGVETVLGKTFAKGDAVSVTKWNDSPDSPVNSYLIDVSVSSSTIFLPERFSFKIHAKGLVSLDYSCTTPSS